MNLTPASGAAVYLAGAEATALGSRVIDSEHLFLGLLKSEDLLKLGAADFGGMGPDEVQSIKSEVKRFTTWCRQAKLDCTSARRRLRRIVKGRQADEGDFSGHRSDRCRKVFEIAAGLGSEEGSRAISLFHLARAVLVQGSPALDELFQEHGISKEVLLRAPAASPGAAPQEMAAQQPSSTPFLDRFGRNLVQAAREGKIDPVIGRSGEIKTLGQVLLQRQKNNAILVGDAGVGKTCIVEGLALKCIDPGSPKSLRDLKIYEISMGSLVAGTMYRGQFEERLDQLVKEASSDRCIVIFIDEIHTMLGAGKGGDSLDAANILKPALARGAIRCIGATTTDEYRRHIEKDAALERRFRLVWVDEPTRDEAVEILRGLKPKLEGHHGVVIAEKAIEAAVELSMRYMTDLRLPDKAIDLIDRACAQQVLRSLSFSGSDASRAGGEIGVEAVAAVVSQHTRIPIDNIIAGGSERLAVMETALGRRVKGQDEAIREVAATVRTAKAGLKDPRRPMGVFLFLGSTGTGKTELAKALAEFLFFDENKLIRFDMSEFQEKHSVAKLIGAPPGYIGYDEEGQLSARVRTNPYSVILFDEVEKAHPDILDIFLQIFDEGVVTDAKGRKISFRESIIILTSNLGSKAAMRDRHPIGIEMQEPARARLSPDSMPAAAGEALESHRKSKWGDYRKEVTEAVSNALRPELLNRIQKTIIFYPLDRQTVRGIIGKLMAEVNRRLANRQVTVTLTEDAEAFLLEQGYSEKNGAREMERVIERHIVQPLSTEVIEGRIGPGTDVEARLSENSQGISFRYAGKEDR